MSRCKMICALLCLLLVGHHADAVINKATAQSSANAAEEKKSEIKADDRISNSYGPPSNDYGPPSNDYGPPSNEYGPPIGNQAPVYGPPELVGDHGPTAVFPSLPAEQLPVFGHPAPVYGPPRNILKPHGPPNSIFGPPKINIGPPKLHFGPPKQNYGPPPSFGSYRPPKPQYGPPLKLNGPPLNIPQFSLAPLNQYGPPKPGHGPPIPVSLDTYGPPLVKPVIQFNTVTKDEYGPPPAPHHHEHHGHHELHEHHAHHEHHGHVGNAYGPPLAPPPGVPAPPTPPDIKYDGWQPIAGLAQHQGPSDAYGTPEIRAPNLDHGHNANLPSDSYGTPIHSSEAQDLKSSVRESAQTDNHGLPPPALPQHEPIHTGEQSPPKNDLPPKFNPHHAQLNTEYGVPGIDQLSVVKTVGFELLPKPGALISDGHDGQNHIGGGGDHHHGHLESHDLSISNAGFSSGGNDLSFGHVGASGPSNSYGPPISPPSFGKTNSIASGVSFHRPPPGDTYSAPPLSSYSPNGPYPAAQSGRASPSFSSFGFHGNFHGSSFHKHAPFRHHGSFRPPLSPTGALIPPRNRDPIKFRDAIPTGLLSNLNRYLPPSRPHDISKPPKAYGAPLGQQLPNLNAPTSFHISSSGGHSYAGSFAAGGSFGKHNSAIAAPNAQYGTPLSFVDFNTPAPILTYGAPNFGPASSFGSTTTGFGNNLYNNIGSTLTYGTPVVNGPSGGGSSGDCDYPQSPSPVYGEPAGNPQGPVVNIPSNHGPEGHQPHLDHGSHDSLPTALHPPAPPPPQVHPVPSGPAQDGGFNNYLPPGQSNAQEPLVLNPLPASQAFVAAQGQTLLGPISQSHSSGFQQDQQSLLTLPVSGPASNDGLNANQHTTAQISQEELFKVAVQAVSNSFGGVPVAPQVNHLDLQSVGDQQKTDLKDSYGNPIGITFQNEQVNNELHNPRNLLLNGGPIDAISGPSTSQSQSVFSPEQLTASLTMQGFAQPKSLGANELDASQFLRTNEGSHALALTQALTAEGADGFQIQGSKGTYMLQIQAADGGLGTENSDGSIRHDQVLSNGLLQDILAAIEQPNQDRVHESLQGALSNLQRSDVTFVPAGQFIQSEAQKKADDRTDTAESSGQRGQDIRLDSGSIALFFNNQLGETRKEMRSVSKSESHATASTDAGKSVSKTKTS